MTKSLCGVAKMWAAGIDFRSRKAESRSACRFFSALFLPCGGIFLFRNANAVALALMVSTGEAAAGRASRKKKRKRRANGLWKIIGAEKRKCGGKGVFLSNGEKYF